jgi:hypothetical protein
VRAGPSGLTRFNRWLRGRSERYLLEATQADLARRYLDRGGPAHEGGLEEVFWLRLFVPVYRRLPWSMRQGVILALPGSHRRKWEDRTPRR